MGGLRRDQEAIYPIDAPCLGVNITGEFLNKHKFDEKKTEEMELKTFNAIK